MNIIIIEDIAADAGRLEDLLKRYFSDNNILSKVTVYGSGEDFFIGANFTEADAVFLDIYMDGMSGMEVAQEIRRRGFHFPIIFLTSSAAHAVESYEVRAFDYILKPIEYDKLAKTVDMMCDNANKAARYIKVKEGRDFKKLFLSDIIYVDYHNHYVQIHTGNEMVRTYCKFSDFAEEVAEFENLLICHRCIMINMDKVEKIEKGFFVMINGELVPINRKMTKDIKAKYVEYIFSEVGK